MSELIRDFRNSLRNREEMVELQRRYPGDRILSGTGGFVVLPKRATADEWEEHARAARKKDENREGDRLQADLRTQGLTDQQLPPGHSGEPVNP